MIDIKLDAGFMLPPLSHNSLESAAKLYGPDYFINSFRRNVTNIPTRSGARRAEPGGPRHGRPAARARAERPHRLPRRRVPWDSRVGAVPAADPNPAVVGGVNMFRLAARLQINLLDAEPGFFYQGTYLGAKKILSIGGFVRLPEPRTSILAATSSSTCPSAPGSSPRRATSGSGTAGPTCTSSTAHRGQQGVHGPSWATSSDRSCSAPSRTSNASCSTDSDGPGDGQLTDRRPMNPSEDRYGGGLAFWPYGFNSNLKVFFLRVHRSPAPARLQRDQRAVASVRLLGCAGLNLASPLNVTATGTQRLPRQPARRHGRAGRPQGHLRVVAGDRVRVVRLLPLRHAGAVLRDAVLPARQRDRGAAGAASPPTRRASWCGRSARWCSGASAIWWDGSTPSWSPSW